MLALVADWVLRVLGQQVTQSAFVQHLPQQDLDKTRKSAVGTASKAQILSALLHSTAVAAAAEVVASDAEGPPLAVGVEAGHSVSAGLVVHQVQPSDRP